MIANKIISSFYILEIYGDAVSSVFEGEFGIDKIVCGSVMMQTDLDATASMKGALDNLTADLNLENASEKIDFNPDFFPTLEKVPLTEEQIDDMIILEEQVDDMNEKLAKDGKTAIALTRLFDPLGDFVVSRWAVESPDFKIIGKVAVHQDKYMQHLGEEAFSSENTNTFKLH